MTSVSEVLQLHAEQIQPAPGLNRALAADPVVGIASVMHGVMQLEMQRSPLLIDTEQSMCRADMRLVDAAARMH